ncbi:MAG: MFS transporter [Bacteroidia bacterium]|nr:MFS transporter [Bacteroidia bacterium]
MNNKKHIFYWTLYDWANSVFPLVITSAIFPNYYEYVTSHDVLGNPTGDVLFVFGMAIKNQDLYSYAYAFGLLLVVLIIPLVSGMADYYQSKKKFLTFFCLLGAISTFFLYFLNRQKILLTLIPFVTATLGFWGSVVLYNSFLPLLVTKDMQDRVSARGFSMGYIGSSLLLMICISGILFFKYDPVTGNGFFKVPYAFVLTSVWWLVFGLIAIAGIPEKKMKSAKINNSLFSGFRELNKAWMDVRHYKKIKNFLFSFFFYNTGVQTIMVMAVLFARKEISWSDEQTKTSSLIVSILLIQFLGVAGAWLFSKLSYHLGNIKTLRISILLWLAVCVYAYAFARHPGDFYVLAAMVGLMMGGIQAISRSTFSKFLPETENTASLFSFYDITEKVGIILGTFSFGLISQISGGMRNSVLALMMFFILGYIGLSRVKK